MEEVIPILRVADVARAAAGYRQLGFEQEWEHRFEPHLPVFVSVARGRMRLFLSEHTRDARPTRSCICVSTTSTRSQNSSVFPSRTRGGRARWSSAIPTTTACG